MAITNFAITTNGAGYAESDGLNPIASTKATAVIKNGIVSIVLSDGSSWKDTPLENCTLGGEPLDTNPRIAIDQLALAGFRTPSGGSGGGGSWLTRHKGTLASTVTISSTPVDLTSLLGGLNVTFENGLITYDAVNDVFKADPNTTSYYAFDVVIRLTGTIQGGGTSSFIFELRRPDNVTIITSDYSRIGGTGNLLNTQVSAIDTRVFSGGTDNYQIQGFKIFGRKVDGNDLILTNGVDDFQELILER